MKPHCLQAIAYFPFLNLIQKEPDIEFETKDISLAGRIIANFPDNLTEEQKIPDYLS